MSAGRHASPRADARPPLARSEGAPTSLAEFSEADKERFGALGGAMSFVGVSSVLFGALCFVMACGGALSGFGPAAVGLLTGAVVCGAPGWWIMSCGRSFSSLARTRGGDVNHLLDGALQLRRLFSFARVLVIVQALLLTGAAGAYVWCNFAGDRGGKCMPFFG